MTIKKIIIYSGILLVTATGVLITSLIIMANSGVHINEMYQIRHDSLLLANELKESSRELTAAVRKFTVTGDEFYADEYNDIILIRSGKKPRPESKKIAPGELISINELLIQAQYTEQELALLQQSVVLSDRLTSLEIQAMNAVRGLFLDDSGNYTIHGQPDKDFAMSLIFSPEYDDEVQMIMKPFDILDNMINARLDSDVEAARVKYNSSRYIVWIVCFIVFILFAMFLLAVGIIIVRPIIMCDKFAKQIAMGNLDACLSYTNVNEIGTLASALRSMVQSLLERIHLEERARRFDAVISSSNVGILIKDRNGIITDWNVGAEKILGYTPEEIIGKTVRHFTTEEWYHKIERVQEQLQKGENTIYTEDMRIHKSGRTLNCSASHTILIDENGEYNGSVVLFHDITDIKTAEQKEKRLSAIFAIADAGVIVKDKDGVVQEWNVGAENIFGYKAEETIGYTTHYYSPEESFEEIDRIEEHLKTGEGIVRIDVVRKHKNGVLVDCSASYTPIFDYNGEYNGSVAIFHDVSDKKQMELALREAFLETEEKHKTIMSSMDYASKIQRSLLPRNSVFEEVFSDYFVIWSPRDIVGGDIYWIKKFAEGTVLCVCDCTGHGTPGALLTMIVVSAFEDMIDEYNYKDTSQIIWMLEQRLVSVFNVSTDTRERGRGSELKDGCDIAVLFIAKDGSVTISSGNIHIFICDGKEVSKIKGQKIFIGEGRLKCREDVQSIKIPANPDNKFYVASDGLYDQIGGKHGRPFGYKAFERIILENHVRNQSAIAEEIWESFENYMGSQLRRDDVELITFKP